MSEHFLHSASLPAWQCAWDKKTIVSRDYRGAPWPCFMLLVRSEREDCARWCAFVHSYQKEGFDSYSHLLAPVHCKETLCVVALLDQLKSWSFTWHCCQVKYRPVAYFTSYEFTTVTLSPTSRLFTSIKQIVDKRIKTIRRFIWWISFWKAKGQERSRVKTDLRCISTVIELQSGVITHY